MTIGTAKTPRPPRITVFDTGALGTHAKPKRGLKKTEPVWYRSGLPALANVRPPRLRNWLAGICGTTGLPAYVAATAAEIGFCAVRSKPFTAPLKRSTVGVSWCRRQYL